LERTNARKPQGGSISDAAKIAEQQECRKQTPAAKKFREANCHSQIVRKIRVQFPNERKQPRIDDRVLGLGRAPGKTDQGIPLKVRQRLRGAEVNAIVLKLPEEDLRMHALNLISTNDQDTDQNEQAAKSGHL
jgi:hypothetical protein